MPSDTNISYEAVLADLRAKREKIDAAIAGIETMLGIAATANDGTAISQSSGADVGPGAFLGMSIVDATKKLLRNKRQYQRTEEIVAALKIGGIAFSGDNPINTVGSVLYRNWNSGGDLVRVSRGTWGLAEWHPRLRRRPTDQKNGVSSSSRDGDEGVDETTPSDPTEP